MEKEVLDWYLKKEIDLVLSNGYHYLGKIIDSGKNHVKFKDNKTKQVHVFPMAEIVDVAEVGKNKEEIYLGE